MLSDEIRQALLGREEYRAKVKGERVYFLCPRHDDRTPSAWQGGGSWGCFACGFEESVTTLAPLLGIELKSTNGREPETAYLYHDEEGQVLFEVVRFPGKKFRQRRPNPGGGWEWNLGRCRRVPYRLPALVAAVARQDLVYVVEGEKDVHALMEHGATATTCPGGAGKWNPMYNEFFRGAHVVIVADRDAPGRDHARQVEEHLRPVAASVRIVQAKTGKDAADHVDAGHSVADFLPLEELGAPKTSTTDTDPGTLRLSITRASDIEPEAVTWLWPRWIPSGKLTLLAGDPGEGKSTLTCDWAGQATRGAFNGIEHGVLIITAEDGVADTVRPRLDAAGADVTRVSIVNGLLHAGGDRDAITFKDPAHLRLVEEAIGDLKPGFTVIDPLSAYLGDTDSWKDSAVRSILAPIAGIAERHQTGLLASLHVNKGSQNSKALYRVQGSIGFTGAARSVIFAGHDPDDPQQHAIQVIKSNLATKPPPMGYRIVSVNDTAAIEYTGESELTAERMTEAPTKDEPEKAEQADALLDEMLANGPRLAVEILKAASAVGVSERTLRRAKSRLNVRSRPQGFHGPQEWHRGQ